MIYRAKKSKCFTQIDNGTIHDKNLSYRALGLLVTILSYPDDWKFTVSMLAEEHTDGKKSVLSAWRELEQAGYIEPVEAGHTDPLKRNHAIIREVKVGSEESDDEKETKSLIGSNRKGALHKGMNQKGTNRNGSLERAERAHSNAPQRLATNTIYNTITNTKKRNTKEKAASALPSGRTLAVPAIDRPTIDYVFTLDHEKYADEKGGSDTQSAPPAPEQPKAEHKTTSTSENNHKKSNEQVLRDRFESLWSLYPRKSDKRRAFTEYKRAIKDGDTDKAIRAGIEAYNREIDREHIPKRYIKQGGTFFYNRAWDNDYGTSDSELGDEYSGLGF